MMDSQENTLNQGTIEEPQVEATVAETPAVENTSEAETKTYATKQEVLDRVKEIAHSDEAPQKNELDLLKTTFYKLHLAERDAQMKEYLAGGGDPEKYVLLPDEAEEAFKAEMQIIKEKRAKIFLAQKARHHRKDKSHGNVARRGQQIISGIQSPAARMERD